MATILPRPPAALPSQLRGDPPEELRSGDRMTREEFHRLYERTPDGFKAELIGGVVFVASPVSRRHGQPHLLLSVPLGLYAARTPGVEALNNATIFLDDDSEPQPDLTLRVKPEYGGQSRTTPDGDYVAGPPELVIEIAYSTRAIDLHAKRDDYARCGVREYLVWVVKEGTFAWSDLAKNAELTLPDDGIARSLTFPGLWLDGAAIRAEDPARLVATLEAGLATPEHSAFVKRLADARR